MIEFDVQVATVTIITRHLAETENLVMQAARNRPVNDNTDREQRLADVLSQATIDGRAGVNSWAPAEALDKVTSDDGATQR